MATTAQPEHVIERNAPNGATDDAGPIVLFDGLCVFCNGSVRVLMKLDRQAALRYAPLQSLAGIALVEAYGVPDSVDSVVLIDGGRAFIHSAAALGITRRLGLPWSLAMVLWLIPAPIRDWAYRLVARHRYRFFGRREACAVPTEAQRRLILEREEDAAGAIAAVRPEVL